MSSSGKTRGAWLSLARGLSSARVEDLEWAPGEGGGLCAEGQFDFADDDDDDFYDTNEELYTTQASDTHINNPARNVFSLGVGSIDDYGSGDVFVDERNDGSADPSDAVAVAVPVDVERNASLVSHTNLNISMGKHLSTTNVFTMELLPNRTVR
eukprot:CAMPEP_0198281286 /NCGR_PEP_ID=MMETSP1449-20131203/1259_1 /TAXON_ID=420275 /ORGANISM="Attheya septentrionalis, Strain CCMP2084" /LENGTH=153 /DNA_ID=CAMNT_0043977001 /DNA_START=38 /DNA_END=496 /DNA_ORIENTATION=-